jgi:hypothetical protein
MAVPFVLHSQPTAIFEPQKEAPENEATVAQRRYVEIMRDVEELINDHSIVDLSVCPVCRTNEIQLHINELELMTGLS